jgi:hypothetical protein
VRIRSYDPHQNVQAPRQLTAFRQRFASAWAAAA